MGEHEIDEVIRNAARLTSSHTSIEAKAVLADLRPGLKRARSARRLRLAGALSVIMLSTGAAAASLVDHGRARNSVTTTTTVPPLPDANLVPDPTPRIESVSDANEGLNSAPDSTADRQNADGDPVAAWSRFDYFMGSVLVQHTSEEIIYPVQFELSQGWIGQVSEPTPSRVELALTNGSVVLEVSISLNDGALEDSVHESGAASPEAASAPDNEDPSPTIETDADAGEDSADDSDAEDRNEGDGTSAADGDGPADLSDDDDPSSEDDDSHEDGEDEGEDGGDD